MASMKRHPQIVYSAVGWLLMTTMAVGGCSETADRGLALADSAGVEIVTNLPGSIESAEAWSLSAEPTIEIGAGASPDVPLSRVTGVTPLAAARVAVGTYTPPRVLVFESDGTLTTTLGRAGEGPGEFASVGSVVPLGPDSVAVWDPDHRRISVFTVDGRFARDVDLSDVAPMSARAAASSQTTSGITHLLTSGTGTFVLWGEGMISPGPENPVIRRPEMPAYRITTNGEELAIYGPIPGMTTHVGGPAGALPLPLGARTYAATTDAAFVVGTADTTEFRVYGPTGELTRIVRWPDHDRAVEGPFLSKWSDKVAARPEMRSLVDPLPKPARFPAYDGLIATDSGRILVGDYPGPRGIWPIHHAHEGPEAFAPEIRVPARRWLVFEGDGALTARVSTPEGFEPYAVRGRRMWGVYTDQVDVESIRAYRLTREGGAAWWARRSVSGP